MISVSDLSELIDCSVEGNSELLIEGVGDLRSAPKNFVSFLRFLKKIQLVLCS